MEDQNAIPLRSFRCLLRACIRVSFYFSDRFDWNHAYIRFQRTIQVCRVVSDAAGTGAGATAVVMLLCLMFCMFSVSLLHDGSRGEELQCECECEC